MLHLDRMPKTELHRHLAGAIEPETLLAAAAHDRVALSGAERALLAGMRGNGGVSDSLTSYLAIFPVIKKCMRTAWALEECGYSAASRAAEDGVRYLELRLSPYTLTSDTLTAEDAADSILRGVRRAETEHGITANLLFICMRDESEDFNLRTVELAARYAGRGVAGVDLAGDESKTDHRAMPFAKVFARAHELGLPVTIHAGEAAGADSVRAAIEMGARRIGHGVRTREDPALIDAVRERGITLEMCPVSNLDTRAAASWADYPLSAYLEAGLRVTVNTDNNVLSSTSCTREYEELRRHCGLGDAEIVRTVRCGIDAAFTTDAVKARLRRALDHFLTEEEETA